ncbi:MAG TPA: magnesium transporter CorA, partial [Alicycliphilus sp.]|nr:magnesium transporter CorA [Alicycliphilus sp.]
MTENTLQPIRVFHLQPGSGAQELAGLPQAPPAQGFYWIACTRAAFSA